MREIRPSGSMSGGWKQSMVRLVRHRRTKELETDRPHLNNRATSRLYSETPEKKCGPPRLWPRYTTNFASSSRVERLRPRVEHLTPRVEHLAPRVERLAPPLERLVPRVEHLAPTICISHFAFRILHLSPRLLVTYGFPCLPSFVQLREGVGVGCGAGAISSTINTAPC